MLVPPRVVERPRTRRPLWGIAVAVALAAAGYLAITRARSVPAEKGATAVPAVALPVGEVRQTLRVSGTLEAEKFVTLLAPRIQGSRSGLNRGGPGGGGGLDFNLVLLRLAKPGTMVKAGDVVGQFDTENQLQRLDDYRDAVVQLEGTIGKMKANLAAAEEARAQAVRSAKADWDKALLDLKTAAVRSEIDAERFRLTAEENELSYQEQLRQIVPFEESQRAALRAAEFNLGQARSELQRAEKNIDKMTIKAPIDGMVVLANVVQNSETRQVREGDQIFAGQPFVSVVDPSAMVLKATVNQVDAERLRLGMKASVHLDAYPEFQAAASLIGIGAMSVTSTFRASFVGEIPVRLRIEGRDPRLIPDLTGSADVTLATESNVTVAPREAVFDGDGGPFVYVKNADGWKRQDVELGLSSFTHVAVRSGARPGDTIAMGAVL
jgi:multidrug efflux pump subunit AcrA (membrane-fusion protein)